MLGPKAEEGRGERVQGKERSSVTQGENGTW